MSAQGAVVLDAGAWRLRQDLSTFTRGRVPCASCCAVEGAISPPFPFECCPLLACGSSEQQCARPRADRTARAGSPLASLFVIVVGVDYDGAISGPRAGPLAHPVALSRGEPAKCSAVASDKLRHSQFFVILKLTRHAEGIKF